MKLPQGLVRALVLLPLVACAPAPPPAPAAPAPPAAPDPPPKCVPFAPAACEEACARKDADACMMLGKALLRGRGVLGRVTEDPQRAGDWLRKGCDGGHAEGCRLLGHAYDEGQGVPKDAARARALLDKACDGGSGDACLASSARASRASSAHGHLQDDGPRPLHRAAAEDRDAHAEHLPDG